MSTAKKVLDFYINSSIHVALAVNSLTIITSLHLNIPIEKSLLVFIFFGTVTAYNFVKYAGLANLHHRNLAKSLRIIQIFSLFCFLGLIISSFYISIEVIIWAGCFGLITLLYALPVFSRRRNLRSISGLKIYVIALVCAGVTVVLPIISYENTIFDTSAIEFFQRFLLVLPLILPFEIRDLKYDLDQLGTIPQKLGVTSSKILGLGILACVIALEFLKSTATLETKTAIGMMSLITAIFIWRSKRNQSRYFASFWVESIPMIWLLLLVLLRSL